MPEFLTRLAEPLPPFSLDVLLRLVVAMIFGGLVTLVYRFTRAVDEIAPSFVVTLVLLSILIAMVTQVIGDNVARAFSLVGALSIVRFRTVVRDTQDTAYVIFAVAVGMAVGAGHSTLALSGIAVVAVAAFAMRRGAGTVPSGADPYVLKIRLSLSHDAATTLSPAFDQFLVTRHLTSIETARQGTAVELTYTAALRDDRQAEAFVKALNRLDGVQNIALERMDQQVE